MRKNIFVQLLGILLVLFSAKGHASEQKLPVIDGQEIVAMVNGDPITLGEFNRALSAVHSEAEQESHAGKIDYKGILDRMITVRLVRQEATTIGLNELPEVKELVDKYSGQTLNGLLRGEYVKNMVPNEEEIDRLYKDAVREFKIKSALFNKKNEADKVEAEIKANGNFDEIVNRVVADKTAKGQVEGVYVKGLDLWPQIVEAASKMEVGDISPVIDVKEGFIIFRYEGMRLPENPAAKEEAAKQALAYKRKQAVEEYKESLIKKYIKVNEEVLESLDYEASPEEFEKLLADTRVVAEIKGEQPVTVGELTEALKNKYYHGVETPMKQKKLNDKKRVFLFDNLLLTRVFTQEALQQGIDKLPVYKSMVKEYESSVLFNYFVTKVVVPDIKVNDETIEKYYKEHIDEYSTPEMMRINSIVFQKRDDAVDAIDRLKKGTDFKWLKSNAEDQVDKDAEGLISFDGTVIGKSDLPEGMLKAISGAGPGDLRLYTSPETYYYVLYIQDIFPVKPLPLEDIKARISDIMFRSELNNALDVWAKKLREYYDVKVYATEF